MTQRPTRDLERGLTGPVAGVDEVGRGCTCGPVVAAAVILPPSVGADFDLVRDSKTLGALQRGRLSEVIKGTCIWAIGEASAAEVDRYNVLEATFIAMRRAVAALPSPPGHALVDGNRLPSDLGCPATTVVKGDASCLAIAAASIIAKQHRDAIMIDLASQFPGYGWENSMGYPTIEHQRAVKTLGFTVHHRRSYNWAEPDLFDAL